MEKETENSRPLISVIVPVYNTAPYLRRCLNSLCAQSYNNLEIICVDDGSTDESPVILKEYEAVDSRIIVLSQQNAGLAAARNAAINIAKGYWITGLDSDDWIEPDAYESLLPAIATNSDIICFDCLAEGDTKVEDSPLYHSAYSGAQQATPHVLLNTNCFFVTKLWRRSFIEEQQIRFPNGLRYEDAFFYYAIAPYARSMYYMPKNIYHYWQRSDSIMHQRSEKGADHLEIVRLILRRYQDKPLPSVFGVPGPSRFELHLMESYTFYALDHTPGSLHPAIRQKAEEIAKEFGILQAYPRETAWLKKYNKWISLFIKARRGKLSYCLFSIPIISFQFKTNLSIIRLFGIKISKKTH